MSAASELHLRELFVPFICTRSIDLAVMNDYAVSQNKWYIHLESDRISPGIHNVLHAAESTVAANQDYSGAP